jgi:drug/metabolite transporter (DMT)-like permease
MWLLRFPALMSFGQLLFRYSAMHAAGKPFHDMVATLFTMPVFYGAVTLYGMCTLLWVWLLGRDPLAIAYPFAALAVVLVPLLDTLVFKQQLTGMYWLGLAGIISGVFLIVLSGQPG